MCPGRAPCPAPRCARVDAEPAPECTARSLGIVTDRDKGAVREGEEGASSPGWLGRNEGSPILPSPRSGLHDPPPPLPPGRRAFWSGFPPLAQTGSLARCGFSVSSLLESRDQSWRPGWRAGGRWAGRASQRQTAVTAGKGSCLQPSVWALRAAVRRQPG